MLEIWISSSANFRTLTDTVVGAAQVGDQEFAYPFQALFVPPSIGRYLAWSCRYPCCDLMTAFKHRAIMTGTTDMRR